MPTTYAAGEKSVCLRLRIDEYHHLQTIAQQCGTTPTGIVRRLVRAVRVVSPQKVQPAELRLELEKID